MIRVREEELRRVGHAILRRVGASEEDAGVVVDSLVRASLMAYDSHGVIRIPQYVREVREGQIRLDAQARVVAESAAFAVLDGGWGFGQVAGRMAARLAVDKASREGVAAVTLRFCNHLGRVGEYPELIADQGMVGLALTNGLRARVAPFGGVRPCLPVDVLAEAKGIYQASSQREGRQRFRRWKAHWEREAPKAVACLQKDLDSLLAFFAQPKAHWKKIRTTNVIERQFREVRRRTKLITSFPHQNRVDHILWTIVQHANQRFAKSLLKELTQKTRHYPGVTWNTPCS